MHFCADAVRACARASVCVQVFIQIYYFDNLIACTSVGGMHFKYNLRQTLANTNLLLNKGRGVLCFMQVDCLCQRHNGYY